MTTNKCECGNPLESKYQRRQGLCNECLDEDNVRTIDSFGRSVYQGVWGVSE